MKKSFFSLLMVLIALPLSAALEPEVIAVHPLCAPTDGWNQSGRLNELTGTLCGCNPLAWGQVITYHGLVTGFPGAGWQPKPVTDFVQMEQDGQVQQVWRTTTPGAYDWKEVSDQGYDAARLMWDLGILGHTLYADTAASGTVTSGRVMDYFGYKGKGWIYTLPLYWKTLHTQIVEESWPELAERLMRGTLHAGAPSVVGITTEAGGLHAIICDGYGYAKDGSLLFHFHDGWGKGSDKWRPISFFWTVGNPAKRQEGISTVYVNVHPEDLGCVLAGRVTRKGKPVEGAQVTLSTGETRLTDPAGCYCFTRLAPETDYTVQVKVAGVEVKRAVKTGRFIDDPLRNQEQDKYKDRHVFAEGGNILADFDF